MLAAHRDLKLKTGPVLPRPSWAACPVRGAEHRYLRPILRWGRRPVTLCGLAAWANAATAGSHTELGVCVLTNNSVNLLQTSACARPSTKPPGDPSTVTPRLVPTAFCCSAVGAWWMPFMVTVSVSLSGVPLENDCLYQSPKKKKHLQPLKFQPHPFSLI